MEKSDKCHWYKNEFLYCDEFTGQVTTDSNGECRCAACRADIRKPERGFPYPPVPPTPPGVRKA